MKWQWQAEPCTPRPAAVAACGPAARELLARARRRADAGWQVAAHADLLFLAGSESELPWCDGALYAAARPEAPSLWLPTTQRPSLSLDLLQSAIQRRHGRRTYLLLPEPAQIVPLDRLIPASEDVLAAIAARWG
jgi:hypothetical protein